MCGRPIDWEIAKGFLLCHILDVDASQTKISVSLRKFLEVKQHVSMGSQESCLRLRHTPAPAGELTQQFPATSHLTIASRHVSKTESVAKAGFRDESLATGVSKTGPWVFSDWCLIFQFFNSSPLDRMDAISQTTVSAFSWITRFIILIWISLKFLPTDPISSILASVQIMA